MPPPMCSSSSIIVAIRILSRTPSSPGAAALREIARRPNVVAKISGIVTNADPASWTAEKPATLYRACHIELRLGSCGLGQRLARLHAGRTGFPPGSRPPTRCLQAAAETERSKVLLRQCEKALEFLIWDRPGGSHPLGIGTPGQLPRSWRQTARSDRQRLPRHFRHSSIRHSTCRIPAVI